MTYEELHHKILTAVTKYDIQQSKKPGYNIYALGHYCKAVSNTMEHIEAGYPVRLSILNCFCGRLLDRVLKAAGEPKHTQEEAYVAGKLLTEKGQKND
jgi:hypothetical protein